MFSLTNSCEMWPPLRSKNILPVGCLGGSAVEHVPWAQGMIPGSQDGVPHRAPRREPAPPSAYVSASLCLS